MVVRMGQALYRKYRSRSLDEIIGQEHITRTLARALKQGRISHAYLFTGPRGVGKTSVARILAHAVNDLPYKDDSMHLDIIEIDAASNRRIDEIRELRDKVHVAPTSVKYKVYIIDEVHMLTREAFNALLKTLEEPPAHVIFILATTDAHKLPETIVSRTQRFGFKPIEAPQVAAHLKQIAKTEKIKVSDEALQLLAEHGEGSFRDSISLLDQASNHADKVELSDVQRLLGIPPAERITDLLDATLGDTPPSEIMQAVTALYDQGYQAPAIAKRLGQAARSRLVDGRLDTDTAFRLLANLIEVPASHDPERFLEIILLRARPRSLSNSVDSNQPKPAESSPPPPAAAEPGPPKNAKSESKGGKPTGKPKSPAGKALNPDIWSEVLQALKQQHNTLYSVVRMAEPDFSRAGILKLTFVFAFHQKRLNEDANRQKLAAIIKQLAGVNVKIESEHNKAANPPAAIDTEDVPSSDTDLTTISNIFGDAELLES